MFEIRLLLLKALLFFLQLITSNTLGVLTLLALFSARLYPTPLEIAVWKAKVQLSLYWVQKPSTPVECWPGLCTAGSSGGVSQVSGAHGLA